MKRRIRHSVVPLLWMLLLILPSLRASSAKEAKAAPKAGQENENAATEAEMLRERIAGLKAQNQALREEFAALKAQIAALATASDSSPAASSASKQLAESASEASETPPPAAPQKETLPATVQTEGNRSALSFYGFVRVDAIWDDSRPSAIQTPAFILPEAPGTGGNGDFTFHPRLTRLGLNYQGPALDNLGGARISGKIETDFQNGGRESRAIARYRHAYFKLSWENSSLLLGQTWDIISPLYPTVNSDTMMWNAGNLGDRRMQFRYSYEPTSGFSLRAGLALTGAVDSQDQDGNGLRDGEDSALPNLQARAGYKSPGGRAEAGIWSHWARLQTQAFFGGENEFDSYSVGVDYNFRFNSAVSVKGELWRGANLSDFRGGIGQSFNPVSGREIASRGGWIELGLKAPRVYTFSTGFTIDDPENGDLLPGGRSENRAWYVTNRFRLAAPLLVGIDYLFWKTDFNGLPEGTDNRVNAYFVYSF